MSQILIMIIKEFKQIFRTREMIGIIFGVPLMQLLILGFTITNEVKNVSLLITDQDKSQISREITGAFGQTDRFILLGIEHDTRNIREAIQRWNAQMAIIIPPGFNNDLEKGEQPDIQVLVDGLDGNTAGIALGYARGILTGVAETFLSDPSRLQLRQQGRNLKAVTLKERMWYNMNLDYAQYMIPGIVVVLLTIISMMLSAMSLVREKEIGTLEQLMVTPLKRYQLLSGKILPFLFLTFFELGVVMSFAIIIFDIHIEGNLFLFGLIALFYLFTTLGFGIFVSTITRTQQQAMFISWFLMVFMLLMSGFFIPIENMPPLLQKLTYLNPMRYIMYITRDIVQKGSSFYYLLVDVIPMAAYGLLIFILGVLNFHKRLA